MWFGIIFLCLATSFAVLQCYKLVKEIKENKNK